MTDEAELLRALLDELERLERMIEMMVEDVRAELMEPEMWRQAVPRAAHSLVSRAECRLAQLEREAIEALPETDAYEARHR